MPQRWKLSSGDLTRCHENSDFRLKITFDTCGNLWQLLPQMNTKNHNAAQGDVNLEAELRARVPKWMKEGVHAVANSRVLDDADILREALAEYLQRRNQTKPEPANA